MNEGTVALIVVLILLLAVAGILPVTGTLGELLLVVLFLVVLMYLIGPVRWRRVRWRW